MEANDSWYGFQSIRKFFNINNEPLLKSSYDSEYVFSIYIELSRNRHVYTRSVYALATWVKDFGGLHKGLYLIGNMFMFLRNKVRGDILRSFLAKHAFKKDRGQQQDDSAT